MQVPIKQQVVTPISIRLIRAGRFDAVCRRCSPSRTNCIHAAIWW